MIGPTTYTASSNAITASPSAKAEGKHLRMVKNERMAGFVPKWEKNSAVPSTLSADSIEKIEKPKPSIEQSIADQLSARIQGRAENSPQVGYAYGTSSANIDSTTNTQQDESFGFADLVDMVNPLHHLPIVGTVYRHLTGDEIKGIGRVIGGGIFGGPLGAAAGLANLIALQETGSDITENAWHFRQGIQNQDGSS